MRLAALHSPDFQPPSDSFDIVGGFADTNVGAMLDFGNLALVDPEDWASRNCVGPGAPPGLHHRFKTPIRSAESPFNPHRARPGFVQVVLSEMLRRFGDCAVFRPAAPNRLIKPIYLQSSSECVRLASTPSLYVYALSPPTCESQYVVGSVKNSPCLQRGRIASSLTLMPRPGPVGTGM